MVKGMGALAIATLVAWPLVAHGGEQRHAGLMTLEEFRQHSESARVYMVFGAIAVTSHAGVACPVVVTIGEWQAALMHRPLDVAKPWVAHLLVLMDERGCAGGTDEVKADT